MKHFWILSVIAALVLTACGGGGGGDDDPDKEAVVADKFLDPAGEHAGDHQ